MIDPLLLPSFVGQRAEATSGTGVESSGDVDIRPLPHLPAAKVSRPEVASAA